MKEGQSENSFGVAGVVLGVFSVASLSIMGAIIGVVGLIFSIRQRKTWKNKWAKYGLILNILGIILGVVATILFVNYATSYLGQIQALQG